MKPVEEIHRLTPDFITWADYNPDVRCDCGCSAARGEKGWILFDPLPLAESVWTELTAEAAVAAIVLTSGNHQRESLVLRERFGAPIHAPAAARAELVADVWHTEGAVVGAFRLVSLPGAAVGESAWCDGNTLVLGDALIHLDGLAVLPDKYCADPRALRASLQKLAGLDFDRAAFAHGDPIATHAGERVASFVKSLV